MNKRRATSKLQHTASVVAMPVIIAGKGVKRRTQAERRAEAERRLLDAALQIVARRGVARLTLAEIGEAAGYSRGLPLHHFGSKAGLLHQLAIYIGERFEMRRAALPPREPGLDWLRGFISLYFRRKPSEWTETRALLVMMADSFIEESELWGHIAPYNKSALSMIEQHLKIGMDKGEIRSHLDPNATAAFLLGTMRGVMLQRLMHEVDLEKIHDLGQAAIDALVASPQPTSHKPDL